MNQYCTLASTCLKENKASKIKNFKINKVKISFVLGVFLVMSIFFYLIQINSMATQGYVIKDLENKIYEVKNENKKLALNIVSLQSLTDLDQKISNLEMLSVDKIVYLTPEKTVAQR